jgi:hypothetical protein
MHACREKTTEPHMPQPLGPPCPSTPSQHLQHAYEVPKRQTHVAHQPLYLVELCEVRAVDLLVAENTVDGEVLGRTEALLRGRRKGETGSSTENQPRIDIRVNKWILYGRAAGRNSDCKFPLSLPDPILGWLHLC